MKCDNCIKNGICKIKAQLLKMHPLGKIGYCYSFIEKDSEPKPITNGDRIRAMSDEELAWELMTWRIETAFRLQGVESDYPYTQKTILDWLKQPVEEET